MPIPSETIYRDAADFRITWKEALEWTLIIDEQGDIQLPRSELDKQRFETKLDTLQRYSRITNNTYLRQVLNKI